MSAYPTDCPQWQCPHLSQHDAREGRVCQECPPCTCGLATLRDGIMSPIMRIAGGSGVDGETVTFPRPDLRHQHQEFTDTTARYEAGEDVVPGDCWRACLASLLEVPLAEVPHFIHLHDGGVGAEGERVPDDPEGPRWWAESVAWVEQQRPGWTLAAWGREGFAHPFYMDPELTAGAPDRLIVTGPSPRGQWNHSALYWAHDGLLAHDPFPDGGGVLPGSGDVAAVVRPEWLVS